MLELAAIIIFVTILCYHKQICKIIDKGEVTANAELSSMPPLQRAKTIVKYSTFGQIIGISLYTSLAIIILLMFSFAFPINLVSAFFCVKAAYNFYKEKEQDIQAASDTLTFANTPVHIHDGPAGVFCTECGMKIKETDHHI